MSQACSRCGRVDHIEYGSDGLAYCSSCIFYGLNKQCWKCRMYLPASELQQYRGQWTCPICIQDMRYQDQRASEYRHDKDPLRVLSYVEQCERCGRNLETVYVWNGRKLCKRCMEEEQESWGLVGGGPSGSSQKVSMQALKISKQKSLLQFLIDEFLALLGLRKKRVSQVVTVEPVEIKMPISRAKPMQEGRMEKKKYKTAKVEGLMKVRDEERDMKLESEGIVSAKKKTPAKKPRKSRKRPSGKKPKK